jgi:hypothetical protein
MNKLLPLVFVIGSSIVGAAAAHAMPVAHFGPMQAGLTIPVSNGCGIGVHRGPLSGCTPIYAYYSAHYGGDFRKHHRRHPHSNRNNYYVSFHDFGGYAGENKFCSFGSYVACVSSGRACWVLCY